MLDLHDQSSLQAASSATVLLEQAVSMLMLVPRKSKNQLIRFDSMEQVVPMALYFGICCGSFQFIAMKSALKPPT